MGVLVKPPKDLHYGFVREFYENALPTQENPFNFLTRVGGTILRFNMETINACLENPYRNTTASFVNSQSS